MPFIEPKAPTFVRSQIKDNWSFSQVSSEHFPSVKETWESCKVPTSVHVELKRLGKISDPFKDLNEWECQCESAAVVSMRTCLTRIGIQEADWVFKTSFEVKEAELKKDCVDLLFEGLDTYCTISVVSPALPSNTLSDPATERARTHQNGQHVPLAQSAL
jgi:beta-mannosidase